MLIKLKKIYQKFLRSLSKRIYGRKYWDFDRRFLSSCDIVTIKKLLSKGVAFPHPVGIVISRHAKIGKNCRIWQNVTIGAKSDADGVAGKYPKIGPHVYIYAGAVIFGDITIGRHAIIAANSVVNTDVPPYVVVAGSPARQIGFNRQAIEDLRKAWNPSADTLRLHNPGLSEYIAPIGEKSVCIDCGANIGTMTALLADKGATVYAFEPHSGCAGKLKTRFAGNPKVTILDKAVLDKEATIKLYHSHLEAFDAELFSESCSLYPSSMDIDAANYETVDAIDLVAFVDALNCDVDLLKLDVEGAEYAILAKMITTGTVHKIRRILVEPHEDRIPEIREDAKRVREAIRSMRLNNIHLDWI